MWYFTIKKSLFQVLVKNIYKYCINLLTQSEKSDNIIVYGIEIYTYNLVEARDSSVAVAERCVIVDAL